MERSEVLKDDERARSLISKVSEFYLSIFSGDSETIAEWFLRIAKTHFKNLIPPEYVISLSSLIVDFTIEKLIIFYKSLIKILGIRRDLLIRLAKYGTEKI